MGDPDPLASPSGSAHVLAWHEIVRIIDVEALELLNLLNELRKRDKCKACRAFFRFFATSLINSNNTGARVLDSIHHLTLKYLF